MTEWWWNALSLFHPTFLLYDFNPTKYMDVRFDSKISCEVFAEFIVYLSAATEFGVMTFNNGSNILD